LPRLKCTFREFIEIITARGFVEIRHGATSHCRYRGIVGGQVRFVDVAAHSLGDNINPNTLASMIRQSGLDKALFRK